MNRPKVLVFIDWYAPGFRAGGPVRSLVNMVDHLRDRIDFHIVTGDTDYTCDAPYPEVPSDRWTVLPGGEKVWYASAKGINRSAWRRLLREQAWSAVYINGVYSYWFSIMPLFIGTRLRRIVAVRGMLADGAMRQGRIKKAYFIRAMRMLRIYRRVRFQATNADEVKDIRRWVGEEADVVMAPNLPALVHAAPPVNAPKVPGELKLVGLARIAVEKNTHWAIEALRAARGAVSLDLYGPVYDQAYWQRCRALIARLPANITVRHHGPLEPEAVAAALPGFHAAFMPSMGENFGHAMLESMAAGLPLIISDRTPWKDLERQHAGWDLPLDEPETFTAVIDRLCAMDQDEYDRWRAGAFRLAERTLSDPGPVEATYRLLTE
jgi:glycosyltransferase involved in cell wall biosynthesis